MANNNPKGSSKFWFEGGPSYTIDNGSTDANLPWIGTTNFWHQGTPQGFLQGGPGSIGDSPQNLVLVAIRPPVAKQIIQSYGVIL